jgi:hypothetical protein
MTVVTPKLEICARLRERHYLSDYEHRFTPDRVLDLIQHTFRPEREQSAALIETLVEALEAVDAEIALDGQIQEIVCDAITTARQANDEPPLSPYPMSQARLSGEGGK